MWIWLNKEKEKRLREDTTNSNASVWKLKNPIKTTHLESLIYNQRTLCQTLKSLCMLPLYYWAYINFGHFDLKSLVLLVSSIPSGIYFHLTSFPMRFSEPWGKGLNRVIPLGLKVPRSSIFFIMSGCVSSLICPCLLKRNCLWWWLIQFLIYKAECHFTTTFVFVCLF